MSEIYSGVACNLDANLLSTTLPLFEQSKVGAIEWSFDALYQRHALPAWFTDLLGTFSQAGRLIGHGVFFSLFSARWTRAQRQWLKHLEKLSSSLPFDHITEHFGFMTGRNFHQGAPLPVPFTPATLSIGIDRLKRIQGACPCPVGLENLAFAYCLDEVKKHGEFLDLLVTPVNGFIILDLHNLYCQMHNFDVAAQQLLDLYPLHRVREIHLSGGSWDESPEGRPIRRDTHDDGVPEEVFRLLHMAMPQCPNLRYVVLEQLSSALATSESQAAYRRDFLHMEEIVRAFTLNHNNTIQNAFRPDSVSIDKQPIEDDILFQQQQELAAILEDASSLNEATRLLQASALAHSVWHIEAWQPRMLETARQIAHKWKNG